MERLDYRREESPVVNEEARRRGKRLDSKDSSEIDTIRLQWRVGMGRRQEFRQPGAGHTGKHSKGGRRCTECGRKLTSALLAMSLPQKPSLGIQNQIKREANAML